MKLYIYCILFLCTATANSTPNVLKADEITYDFLVATGAETAYCDHIPVFKKVFESVKVKTLLEFGLGYSTKYFLDNCTKVISVEFISAGWSPDWIRKCLDLYKGYSNWVPVAYFTNYKGDFSWAPYKYFGSESLYKANDYFVATNQSYHLIDPSYSTELNTFISNLSKYNKIDVALVDQGNCLRGELVQLLFGKVPIIVSHDTTTSYCGFNPYGFASLKIPEDYEEIRIFKGVGTTVWIQKKESLAQLTHELKDYAK